MDIDNNSKFQLHHQHQPPKQHKYRSMSMTFRAVASTNLEAIQIIKKPGGSLKDSFLDKGKADAWY
ncbi:unnamed protein product [Camellia sinensis]